MSSSDDNQTNLEFPCDYSIKVIGQASTSFEGEVIAIVRQHFPNLGEGAVKQNHSKQKNYMALTINLRIETKAELDKLYQALSDNPLVLFAL